MKRMHDKVLVVVAVISIMILGGCTATEEVAEEEPSEEVALEDIPEVTTDEEETKPVAVVQTKETVKESTPLPSPPPPPAPALVVTEEPRASHEEPIAPPASNNCHTRGSGCENIESQVEEQWQAQQQEQPYDNEPSVTGVPCAVWTCRNEAGESNAEIQARNSEAMGK